MCDCQKCCLCVVKIGEERPKQQQQPVNDGLHLRCDRASSCSSVLYHMASRFLSCVVCILVSTVSTCRRAHAVNNATISPSLADVQNVQLRIFVVGKQTLSSLRLAASNCLKRLPSSRVEASAGCDEPGDGVSPSLDVATPSSSLVECSTLTLPLPGSEASGTMDRQEYPQLSNVLRCIQEATETGETEAQFAGKAPSCFIVSMAKHYLAMEQD